VLTGNVIRALTISDEPALWELLYHALYALPGHGPFPRDVVKKPEIARYVQGWSRKGDRGVAAVNRGSGAIVGAASCRVFAEGDQGYGWLGRASDGSSPRGS